MKTSNLSPSQEQRDSAAAVLKSLNSVWWAIIERRYSDAEFACRIALAELQDFVPVDVSERPARLRLSL